MNPPDDELRPGDEIGRLRARAERERQAREEAEAIAERSLRHLYQQQQRLQVLQQITAAANEAETPDDALRVALRTICEHTGWPVGHVYRAEGDRLVPTALWCLSDGEGFGRFREVTEQTTFQQGEGLPGRVLASGDPAWITDVQADENFTRRLVGSDLGVHGAFAFPVFVGSEVAAVLEFFSVRIEEPDDDLLDAMGVVGTQLGLAIERHRAQEALRRAAEDLRRSNAELEHFASIASHDLQEPLRMVSSFLQLLQRRYEGRLDETADEYIAYAVDGAKRMQVLIQDLLAYSRVGTRGKPFEPVDMNRAVRDVLDDLGVAIEEGGTRVVVGDLPTVQADPTQARQLFQNLIGNAVKFHGEAPPEVIVSAVRTQHVREYGQEPGWRFAVSDNGIGIAPEHEERIFQIFQRLHTRDEYEGTGIGLAMCKKIVERHGGRIWLESEPGRGATFHFTLPDHPPSSNAPSSNDRVDA